VGGGQVAIRSYSDDVPIRVIAFVLALVLGAGVASSAVIASPDVAGAIDEDAPDVAPVIAEATVVVVPPVRRELTQIAASVEESMGRLHCASVFRPPRGVASR